MWHLPATEVYYHTPLQDTSKCLWLLSALLAQRMRLCRSLQLAAAWSTTSLLPLCICLINETGGEDVQRHHYSDNAMRLFADEVIRMHFHVICSVTRVNIRHKHHTFCPV